MTSRDQARLQATFKQQNVLGHNSPIPVTRRKSLTRSLARSRYRWTYPTVVLKENDKRERSFEEIAGRSSDVSYAYGERSELVDLFMLHHVLFSSPFLNDDEFS
jgi:hypothetical protein